MAHEYVFRGEHKPFKPDPNDVREREAAMQEAEELVHQPPPSETDLSTNAEIEAKVGDYQVGGLDAFGADAETNRPDEQFVEQRETRRDQ